jgi:hypothetical protein
MAAPKRLAFLVFPRPTLLDLGLYRVEKYWGADACVRIANRMEYRGYSPA